MAIENPWLLPQGIEEVLPEEARKLESLRRNLLDLYQTWGYELVMPPMIEFIESLLGDLGKDLDLKTFKLTDQLTGKTMGVRADMTPQVARIDAHNIGKDVPTRLSYMGTVLQTRSDEFASSRSPIQVGCELYGHSGPESDVEVIRLMVATLQQANVQNITVDLGHVGVFRDLAQQCGLSAAQEKMLFEKLQRKSMPEIKDWVAAQDLAAEQQIMLLALAGLNGDTNTLVKARDVLAAAGTEVLAAIDYVEQVCNLIAQYLPELNVHIDLAELHGYHYKTGVVFAAYVLGTGQEVARGGRYDEIGKAFGRGRPATGFSTDLKALVQIGEVSAPAAKGILAPNEHCAGLAAKVAELRAQGESVVYTLAGAECAAADLDCDRELKRVDQQWSVEKTLN
jgi:ATP phosphoribosyltransferase regulatory subunit